MPGSNAPLPATVLLSQSVSEACELTEPHVLRDAQGCDPASLMYSFNSFSGSSASVAMSPGRSVSRVREVATAIHACPLAWVHCVVMGVRQCCGPR